MPGQGGLQLLPETRKRIEVRVPGENRYIGIGISIIVVVTIVSFMLNSYASTLQTKADDLTSQIARLNQQRDKKAEADILAFDRQSKLLTKLLGDHVYLTKAFDRLGNLVQTQVQIKSMKVDTDGARVTFSGVAASYSTVAHQIASFLADDSVQDVTLSTLKTGGNGIVEFGAEILLNQQKFFKK